MTDRPDPADDRTRLSPLRSPTARSVTTAASCSPSPRHPTRPLLSHHHTPLRRPVELRQFVSLAFGQAAAKAGIARSMGSRGDCWDNAVAESFFATLKKELVHRRSWPTRAELRQEVFNYVEIFYNATRRHSTLGMLSPMRYEQENDSLEQLNNINRN
jgi:transposase InsO family protein